MIFKGAKQWGIKLFLRFINSALSVVNELISFGGGVKSLKWKNLSTKWGKVVKGGKKIPTFAIKSNQFNF